MTTAFVFPGQGSQAVGMGKALADAYPAAKAVFDEVDDAVGKSLSALMFDGPMEELTLTANTQPALMAVSMAVVRVLADQGVDIARADYLAGHSLGEYSALCAAGTLSLGDTARLLKIRGEAMQRAVPVGVGAMAALLGLEFEDAKAVALDAAQGDVCQPANDNASGQVVVSGHTAAVERAIEIAKAKGAKRAMLLPVSAPFHCALMKPAADEMATALEDVTFSAPFRPIVANVTARPEEDPAKLKSLLVEQVCGAVRWRESVGWMVEAGVTKQVELGTGKVLSGLARRIHRPLEASAIGTPSDIEAFGEAQG
ncbi:MAG: ACP S-malonyltransferase [Pseudomonadota bacterium]